MIRRVTCGAAALLTCCVTLALPASAAQVELVLCIDVSGSIDNGELTLEIQGLQACLADQTIVPQDGTVAVGIVVYGETAADVLGLTPITAANLANTINPTLSSLIGNRRVPTGATNIGQGVINARQMLQASAMTTNDFILLVGDGGATTGPNAQVECGNTGAAGIVICGISVGADQAGRDAIRNCAEATGGGYGDAPTFNDFPPVCRECLGFILQITCLNPVVNADPGQCSATVACEQIAVCRDLQGNGLPITCNPPGPYPVGTTPVTITCVNEGRTFTLLCGVTVVDMRPPTITCPPDVTRECDQPTDPGSTGSATATDNCPGAITITFADQVIPGRCLSERTIRRTWTARDSSQNSASCLQIIQVVDTTAPDIIVCAANGGAVNANCEFQVPFTAIFTDNCGILATDASVNVALVGGQASIDPPVFNRVQVNDTTIVVAGSVRVYDVRQCPARIRIRITAPDRCGNNAVCEQIVDVVDTTPPVITCPPDIRVPFGNKICDSAVQDWLNSATATDNCDPDVTIVNDAPDCGFPCGTTTLVTWTATDDCGNSSQCSASITVDPCERATPSQKGSLLIYPKVEVRYDDQGNVLADTYISLLNDYPAPVRVQLYFLNGDDLVEGAEPGCNWIDNEITLTQNQPTYWSAATGLPQGVSPWSVLDPSTPPGREDPDHPGTFVLRGAIFAWAVNADNHEIRWNHLSGGASLVDYANVAAWDYAPWAYQALCVGHGEEPLDCTSFDANGVCCTAEVIPGKLDLDGFQYDFSPDQLLIDFFASGVQFPTPDGGTLDMDADLTFLPVGADLRQDSTGPVRTKLEFAVWNMNEVRFSGETRCISCWDQALVSTYRAPNHMARQFLQTDKGKARVDGVRSTVCPGSVNAALVGVAARYFTITSAAGDANVEYSGADMVGIERQGATIRYDVVNPGGELNPAPTLIPDEPANATPAAPASPTSVKPRP